MPPTKPPKPRRTLSHPSVLEITEGRIPPLKMTAPPALPALHFVRAEVVATRTPVPAVALLVDGEIATMARQLKRLEDWHDFYATQAQTLVTALCATLPQGTMHAVLIALLQRYTCLYRGPLADAGPLVDIRDDGRSHG